MELTWNKKASQMDLEDKIIHLSNIIHRDTLMGGANYLRMSSGTTDLLSGGILESLKKRFSIWTDTGMVDDIISVCYFAKKPFDTPDGKSFILYHHIKFQ